VDVENIENTTETETETAKAIKRNWKWQTTTNCSGKFLCIFVSKMWSTNRQKKMHCAVCSLWYAKLREYKRWVWHRGEFTWPRVQFPWKCRQIYLFPHISCEIGELQLWRLQFPTFADKKWYIWVMLHGSQRITSALS